MKWQHHPLTTTVHHNRSMTFIGLLMITCRIHHHIQALNKTSHRHFSILKFEAFTLTFHRQHRLVEVLHHSVRVLQHLLQVLHSLVRVLQHLLRILHRCLLHWPWLHRLHTKDVFHHIIFIDWPWILYHHKIKLISLKPKTLMKTHKLPHHNSNDVANDKEDDQPVERVHINKKQSISLYEIMSFIKSVLKPCVIVLMLVFFCFN